MSGECNLLSSVSSQQKFEATDVKALGPSQLLNSPCYSSWTDQFYLENKGKYILKAWGHADPKGMKRGEREREREKDTEPACAQERARPPAPLAPLFICFFLPLGLPYVNYTSQECCLYVLPEVLTPVLHLSLFYFCGLFPSLSFSHRHFGLLFPILPT